MKSVILVEVSGISKGEKGKTIWGRRLTIIFCNLCITKISNNSRLDTHLKKKKKVKNCCQI